MPEPIKERLLFLINDKGLSQNEFCRKIDMYTAEFDRIKKEKSKPKFDHLVKIIKEFNVSPEWLLLGSGDPQIKHEFKEARESEEVITTLCPIAQTQQYSIDKLTESNAELVSINSNLMSYIDKLINRLLGEIQTMEGI